MANKWPKDNQTALIKFFGDPGTGEIAGRLVAVVPPFRVTYGGKPFPKFMVHEKIAKEFARALQKIWDYYGHDQKVLDKLRVSTTAGTYNPRKVRGSATKWSNHAYGSAIDINSENNGFHTDGKNMPRPVVAAFKSEGFAWGGDYKSRKDPMHFEAVNRGEPTRTFEQWLEYYDCPPSYYPGGMAKSPKLAIKQQIVDLGPTDVSSSAKVPEFLRRGSGTPDPVTEVAGSVQGDPDIWHPQRRLKAMSYNPGGLDGVWGGLTGGAIAGFITDRGLKLKPPTSVEEFFEIKDQFNVELSRAEAEEWARPVSQARATATEQQIAAVAPEIVPAQQNKQVGFWGGIAAFFAMIFNAMTTFFKDALEYLQPIREFFADVPTFVWFGVAAVVCYVFYRNANKGVQTIKKAYNSGDRA